MKISKVTSAVPLPRKRARYHFDRLERRGHSILISGTLDELRRARTAGYMYQKSRNIPLKFELDPDQGTLRVWRAA